MMPQIDRIAAIRATVQAVDIEFIDKNRVAKGAAKSRGAIFEALLA